MPTPPSPAQPSSQLTFEPSPAQRRLLDYITAHPEFKTVSDYCAAADVPRASYERWSRQPAFRAWFLREWSRALIFEGWHILTLARANMVNSPLHFKAIFSLLFTPAGQSALAAWQDQCAQASGHPNPPTPPAQDPVPTSAFPPAPVQNQQPAAQKEHYLRPPDTPEPQPSPREAPPSAPRQTRPSDSRPASAPAPPFPQLPEQNQPLTAENGPNPPSSYDQLLQSLRNAILGTRPPPARPPGQGPAKG